MTNLQKLRDEKAKSMAVQVEIKHRSNPTLSVFENANRSFIKGFDAAVEAMQAEINHLKYDNERIKLFNDAILKDLDLCLDENRKLVSENVQIKQALDVAVSTLKFYGNTEDMYDVAYECEGPCIGYIPNEDDFEKIEGMRTKHIGKRARQALTSINEIINRPSGTKYSEESK